jgi:Ca2+-binding RTX toxin-like protein
MTTIESLESRQLLSSVNVQLNAAESVTAKLSRTGLLTITGTAQADNITLKQSGNQIEIDAGTLFATSDSDIVGGKVDISKVKKIVVNAGGGRDFVKVEQLTSRKSIGIQLNGEGANDTLVSQMKNVTLRGGAGNDYLMSDPSVVVTRTISPSIAVDFTNVDWTRVSSNPQGFAFSGGAITGTNVLEGGSGDDRLATRGGDDSVYGGDGNDTLVKLTNLDVYFANLEPQEEPVDGAIRTFNVRVAAFGIDKIVDQPTATFYTDYSSGVARYTLDSSHAAGGIIFNSVKSVK